MKTILLPTDFSKNSMNAINYAIELFENVACNFYILNVQKASSFISDDMMVVSASTTIYSTIIDASKKSIANIISKVEKKYHNKKHQFNTIVDYDNFVDSINQVSEKYQVDLIVMGTKGASGLDRVIFGSNTVKVIQRCHVPVLVIPSNCKFNGLDKVAFTTSFQSLYNKNEMETLNNLVSMYQSELTVLHVSNNYSAAPQLSKNKAFFTKQFKKIKYEFIDMNHDDIYNPIHNFINLHTIKMLAMVARKHSFLERLFNLHTVETFAFNIDVPFLVMHHTD